MTDRREKRSQLIILSCLDAVEPGVMRRFPRHLTLVPWFSLPLDGIDGLKSALASAARRLAPIELTGGDEARFGETGEARVRLLQDATLAKLAHLTLFRLVEEHGGHLRSPQFCGANYVPHVTLQEDGWLEYHESRRLNRIQLGQAVDSAHGGRRIVDNYKLGESWHPSKG